MVQGHPDKETTVEPEEVIQETTPAVEVAVRVLSVETHLEALLLETVALERPRQLLELL